MILKYNPWVLSYCPPLIFKTPFCLEILTLKGPWKHGTFYFVFSDGPTRLNEVLKWLFSRQSGVFFRHSRTVNGKQVSARSPGEKCQWKGFELASFYVLNKRKIACYTIATVFPHRAADWTGWMLARLTLNRECTLSIFLQSMQVLSIRRALYSGLVLVT